MKKTVSNISFEAVCFKLSKPETKAMRFFKRGLCTSKVHQVRMRFFTRSERLRAHVLVLQNPSEYPSYIREEHL